MQVHILSTSPSSTVETEGAIDATVYLADVDVTGDVTLIPSDYDGSLSTWGTGLDHWSESVLHPYLDAATIDEVVAGVRAEVGR